MKYLLVMGLIVHSDPLKNQFTTLIRSIEHVVESNDIVELEELGKYYSQMNSCFYQIVDTEDEHEGLVWSNKAVNQLKELTTIKSYSNLN